MGLLSMDGMSTLHSNGYINSISRLFHKVSMTSQVILTFVVGDEVKISFWEHL